MIQSELLQAEYTDELKNRELEQYNPIAGQDPYVFYDKNRDMYCLYQVSYAPDKFECVTVREAYDVKDLFTAEEKVVFRMGRAINEGKAQREYALWAPEVHEIYGKYYMYYTKIVDDEVGMEVTAIDNRKHRMYVAVADSPTGPFEEVGEIFDPQHHYWGIDMTILQKEVDGETKLYAIWSGWKGNSEDFSDEWINDHGDLKQHIYIAEMESPTKIKAGTTTLLSSPEEDWEGNINEGAQVIIDPNGRLRIFYSANASWLSSYCQGGLVHEGMNPLNKTEWNKSRTMMFNRTNIGHVSFVNGRDGEVYMFYHYKSDPNNPGWDDRKIKFAKVSFEDGIPTIVDDGHYQPALQEDLNHYFVA